jgi:hypothetical protein
MGFKDRARGFFRRDQRRPDKKDKISTSSTGRHEMPSTRSVHEHMADIDGPVVPTELAPRLSSSPRTVPSGRKRRSHSGHPASNGRRSGHGKIHPAHRARQKAKTGRKANVQRLIAAKK